MDDKVICERCRAEGQRSTVTSLPTATTLMADSEWWDEVGNHHRHDLNRRGSAFRCSNGHAWQVSWLDGCPSCDYGTGSRRVSEFA